MEIPLFHNLNGDPKIVKRGPNFEQKGDQKGTFFDVKGDPSSIFSELFRKSEYVKIVKKHIVLTILSRNIH